MTDRLGVSGNDRTGSKMDGSVRQASRARPLAVIVLCGSLLSGCVGAPVEQVLSYRELDYMDIVRQQYDFSCGAASIATLLHG